MTGSSSTIILYSFTKFIYSFSSTIVISNRQIIIIFPDSYHFFKNSWHIFDNLFDLQKKPWKVLMYRALGIQQLFLQMKGAHLNVQKNQTKFSARTLKPIKKAMNGFFISIIVRWKNIRKLRALFRNFRRKAPICCMFIRSMDIKCERSLNVTLKHLISSDVSSRIQQKWRCSLRTQIYPPRVGMHWSNSMSKSQ